MKNSLAKVNLGVGFFCLLFSEIMLFMGIEPFLSWFYCFAWWSYIIIIDSIVFLRKGNSLILSRTKEFLFLLPLSVIVWLIFESLNFVLKNWYYVNIIENTTYRWLGYAIAFATVLPGLVLLPSLFVSYPIDSFCTSRSRTHNKEFVFPLLQVRVKHRSSFGQVSFSPLTCLYPSKR